MSRVIEQVQPTAQFVRDIFSLSNLAHKIDIELPVEGPSGTGVVVVTKDGTICFHFAVACDGPPIDDTRGVGGQAALYRTFPEDSEIYFGLYDIHTSTVQFCLIHPGSGSYLDKECYSMDTQADKVRAKLRTYVGANFETLRNL